MIHEDWERDWLKDQIFLREEATLKENSYLYDDKLKENDGKQATIIAETRVGYEPLYDNDLDKEWGEPAKISGELKNSRLVTYSEQKGLPF